MLIDDLILWVLAAWVVPLVLFVFFFVTDPVEGSRWRRRRVPWGSLRPVSKILVLQKLALAAVAVFVLVVRATGGFPGREWFALVLYGTLLVLAWSAFLDLRRLQKAPLPQDHP